MAKKAPTYKFTTRDFDFGSKIVLFATFETRSEAVAWVKENERRRALKLKNVGHVSVADIGRSKIFGGPRYVISF